MILCLFIPSLIDNACNNSVNKFHEGPVKKNQKDIIHYIYQLLLIIHYDNCQFF